MRGTGSDWAPPADTGCGGGRQLAAVGWEEREAQDPLLPLHPPPLHTLEMPAAQAWEQAGVPQEAQVLTRELVSPKVPDQ